MRDIILEGPDNSGKTSLAKFLVNEHSASYFHAGGPPTDEYMCLDHQMMLMNRSPSDHSCMVIDRCTAISQQVYRPDPVLDSSRKGWLAAVTDRFEPLVVYCRPPTERLMRTEEYAWREGETEEHKQMIVSRALEFIERYDAVMTSVPCVTYDFTCQVSAALLREMLGKYVRRKEHAFEWFDNLINYRS